MREQEFQKENNNLLSSSNLANESLFAHVREEIMKAPLSPASNRTAISIKDIGQIAEMSLPGAWGPSQEKNGFGATGSYKEFAPGGVPDVHLGFFYRGRQISSESGDSFNRVLKGSPHQLSKDELDALSPMLRGMNQAELFDLKSASTGDINGKRVLLLSGTNLASGLETQTIFIEADREGRVVQEIEYQAAQDKFQIFQSDVQKAVRSIVWK
ncbi:MAG: hypothetical protein K2X27_22340 [Candidatus Obscuribacterales bacterium]|nr:hypothetical protein [Candidatus Obscuribacterales bacterium]